MHPEVPWRWPFGGHEIKMLNHNYYELDRAQKVRYWLWYRWTLTPHERYLFEGCRSVPGQMYRAERRALHAAILERRPRHCFEIGTGSGGGSTFFIASALRQLGSGTLVSLEASEYDYRKVVSRYTTELRDLQRYVTFLLGSDPRLFLPFLEKAGSSADCLLLDGAGQPEQAVEQFEFFRPFFHAGSILMAHDWDGEKMRQLRPHIERDSRWSLVARLTRPESVGFVVYSLEAA